MHFTILWGTIVLGFATITVATDHYLIEIVFGESFLIGWSYLIFSGAVDVLGLLLVFGLILALIRRLVIKPQRVEPSKEVLLIIITLLIIAI